jgi:DNA replication protein DnaC
MLFTQTLEKLRTLRLEGMAQALEEQRHQNDIVPLSFEDRLALLVERQWLWKENRGLAIRLQNAQLKISASLEDLDYRSSRGLKRAQIDQLRASSWVKEHRNCLITGPTGSGKTYLACAVAAQACREGYRTLYFYAPKFFRALETARADGSLLPLLKKLARAPLIVVDDLGIASVPGKLYREFLEMLDDRQGQGAPSSPASSRSASGTRSSPIPPWPMPSWTGWFITPTGSNSKVNPCAKKKYLLRKMRIKVRASKARLFVRAGESVTRGDRRERELEFESSFPPLTARPNRRRDEALSLTAGSSPLRGAPKERKNCGQTLTPVGHPFMTPPERRFAPTSVRQHRNGVRYGLEQVSAFIGIRI